MTAVKYQAHFEFQNRYWPISHTSRICGWRRQNFLVCVSGLPLRQWKCAYIPHNHGRIENRCRNECGADHTRDDTQNGKGPGERHDGERDILGEEQTSGLICPLDNPWPYIIESINLLPRASTVLDGVTGLEFNLSSNARVRVRLDGLLRMILQIRDLLLGRAIRAAAEVVLWFLDRRHCNERMSRN